jgi:transposase-like protein
VASRRNLYQGPWAGVYLYRAVDKAGNTVDFRLSDRRNVAAAKTFFKKAIRHQGHAPHTITLDGYAASHRAVREMQNADMLPKSMKLWSSKYLNKLLEQDHRGIKSSTRPMLGFKNSTPPPSPLPQSNCFTVSIRDSSHSVDSNSKI